MKKTMMRNLAFGIGVLFVLGCQSTVQKGTDSVDSGRVALADSPENGWIDLFDGKSLSGWHGYNKTGEVPNWKVEEGGILACTGKPDDKDYGGDLVSEREFGDFELEWEWKISEGGNSGVMYHVIEDPKYKAPYETGPEYQMIDDVGFPMELGEWQKTGANYAMNNADTAQKDLKPVGEWNSSRIVYDNGHVEHWLNGKKIVEFREGTPEWEKEKRDGKWKGYPDYKIANNGKIALQDHGSAAWFRDIRIRTL